jgi:hypothetical protein
MHLPTALRNGMGKIMRLLLSAIGTFLTFGTAVLPTLTLAQDAVPVEILQRTLYIKVGNIVGTAFKVDYKGRVYLITARHVVTALPAIDTRFLNSFGVIGRIWVRLAPV